VESLKGHLLISSGGLYDANFRHTVVLIAHHDNDGVVGVVLNRPGSSTVLEIVPALAALTGSHAPLFEGGPVAPHEALLLVETDDPEILDVRVLDNVGFLTGDVPARAPTRMSRARVFLGHAGWGPGQLEAEMKEKSWSIDPAQADDVFTDEPSSLWRRVLQRKGPPWSTMARADPCRRRR